MKHTTPGSAQAVHVLGSRGVICPVPEQVAIDASVHPERIAPGVILHSGVRLSGKTTSIGPGSVLGAEGPAVVQDCQLGHQVQLKGGFFSGAVFLDRASVGSAAHIRPGTLLEEQAEAAHAVGFKQTILMAYVVTGSLINFCDILMGGGTSRKDHSEVGSSYVHFNFTPHGDKATPSLIGDVPRGVLLDQPRIFLGGQGGLVGPSQLAFGTVIPAGRVHRGDVDEPGLLLAEADPPRRTSRPFISGAYRAVDRLVLSNLRFIGNLHALRAWYRQIRGPQMARDPYRAACCEGATSLLHEAICERVHRLDALAEAMPRSLKLTEHPAIRKSQYHLMNVWPTMREALLDEGMEQSSAELRDRLLSGWAAPRETSYLDVIAGLDPAIKPMASAWLDAIVSACVRTWACHEKHD